MQGIVRYTYILFCEKLPIAAPQKNPFPVMRGIVYLCESIVSCTAIGLINKADGGAGVSSAGACPILLLVFSLAFLIFDIGAFFAAKSLLKAYPAIIEEKQKKVDK